MTVTNMTTANRWKLLNNPVIWELSRTALDLTFGLYRKRIKLMHDWRLLKNSPSVLDVGCGIGQYASITGGDYVGVDLNELYVNYARRRQRQPNKVFRVVDVTLLREEQLSFDLVLMVDFLHHILDAECIQILKTTSQLAKQYVVSFEPITYQPNPIGRWIVEHDRGNFVRPLDKLHALFEESKLLIVESVELYLGPINTRGILCRPANLRDKLVAGA